ncbi:MAG: serine hydrolase domain-containing protein [Candidatus Promineifilaceae bacterium]
MKYTTYVAQAILSALSQFTGQNDVESDASLSSNDGRLAALISKFVQQQAAEDEFSGTLLVAHGRKTLIKAAFGEADKGWAIPNSIKTKFNLGSIAKIFTGVAICQLAQAGKLAFHEPVINHLPDYPNREVAEKVTIHHLLTHTAGLGDFFNTRFGERRFELRTVADYMSLFSDEPLRFQPGSQYRYSNAGAIVLGAIIERVSGRTYYEYVADKIFEAADMPDTGFFELDKVVENLATGYTHYEITYDAEGMEGEVLDGDWRSNVLYMPYKGSPAGGGYSTLDDMLNFAAALQNGRLLQPAFTDTLLSGKVTKPNGQKYSYLINEMETEGVRFYGHNGGAAGVSASFWFSPDLDFTIVVLANYDEASRPVFRFIQQQILNHL